MTLWTVARRAPLSMGFPRQEYWSGLPFPSPGYLSNPGIELASPALQADSLPSEPPGKVSRNHRDRPAVLEWSEGLQKGVTGALCSGCSCFTCWAPAHTVLSPACHSLFFFFFIPFSYYVSFRLLEEITHVHGLKNKMIKNNWEDWVPCSPGPLPSCPSPRPPTGGVHFYQFLTYVASLSSNTRK